MPTSFANKPAMNHLRRLVLYGTFAHVALAASGCRQRALGAEVLAVVPKADSLRQVGEYLAAEQALVAKTGQGGWLHYGPYVELEPASLRAEFALDAEGPVGTKLGTVDINIASTTVPETIVAASDVSTGNAQVIALEFQAKAGAKYEFRLNTTGAGMVKLRRIAIVRR